MHIGIRLRMVLVSVGLLIATSPGAWANETPSLLVSEGERFENFYALSSPAISRIHSVVFSHDGETIAAESDDGTICLWSLYTAPPRRCFSASGKTRTQALAFSADDQWIAVGLQDGGIELLRTDGTRLESPCQVESPPDNGLLGRPTGAVAFAADGSLFVAGAKSGTLRKCDRAFASPSAQAGVPAQKATALPELAGCPLSMFRHSVFALPGRSIAVATTSGVLGVWNSDTGQKRWLRTSLPALIQSMAVSAGGELLVTGLSDGSLCQWNITNGKERCTTVGDGKPHSMRAVAVSPDARQIAAVSDDTAILLWSPGSQSSAQAVSRLYGVSALAYHPSSSWLAAATADRGIVLLEANSGKPIRSLHVNAEPIKHIAFNGDGTALATASQDQQIRIWRRKADASGWQVQCTTLPLEAGDIQSLSFNPANGQSLDVATDSSTIWVINTYTCSHETERGGAKDWVKAVSFSPDGRRFAAGADDGSLILWVGADPEPRRQWRGHSDGIHTLTFAPDGNLLATASFDRSVKLWSAATGEIAQPPIGEHATCVKGLSFSSDGKILAMASGMDASLWDVVGKRSIKSLPHDSAVTAVRFVNDDQILATAAQDGRIRLWELASDRVLAELTLEGDAGPVWELVYSPQQKLLAAASQGRVTLWRPGDLTLQGRLWQAGESWAAWTPSGMLRRSDLGDLLWKKKPDGTLQPVPPPIPDTPARLAVTYRIQPPRGDNGPWGAVIARITNERGGGPAYWVRVEAREVPGAHDLHAKLAVLPSSTYIRLDPDKSIDLPLQVAPREHSALPSRNLRFCLQVRHAHEGNIGPECGDPLSVAVMLSLGPWWWRQAPMLAVGTIGFLLALGLTLLALRRHEIMSQPVVQSSLSGGDPINGLKLHEFPRADRLLRRAEQLRRGSRLLSKALERAGTSYRGWQRSLRALSSAEQCMQQLADSLGVGPQPLQLPVYAGPDLLAHKFRLPPLSLGIHSEVLLVIWTRREGDVQSVAEQLRDRRLTAVKFILFVDFSFTIVDPGALKKALEDLDMKTALAALTEESLASILLAPDPRVAKEVLLDVIVSQCQLDTIAPYREAGGIEINEEGFFFGRQRELERMLRRQDQNFLLIGPRKMGKSSLLNALHREVSHRLPAMNVTMLGLFSDNIIDNLSSFPSFQGDTPAALYDWVSKRTQSLQLYLIDEVDLFLAREAARGYPFCSAMRALSTEGRARFILAGYQDLSDAAEKPDHPLRNFGEVMRLEPLDRSEAAQMFREPMAALRVRFTERDAVTSWLIEQTGCRPHLLARACYAISSLRQLPNPVPLTIDEVKKKVLTCSSIREEFRSWINGSVNPLDRAIARAAILLGRPKPEEVARLLAERSVRITPDAINESLQRLYSWHYVLIRDAQGQLFCPVPLFSHWISDPQPQFADGKTWHSAEARLQEDLSADIAALTARDSA